VPVPLVLTHGWPGSVVEYLDARILSWNIYDRGGHYAAHQAPDLLVQDLRQFFTRCLEQQRQ
jgi:hypothetical protein